MKIQIAAVLLIIVSALGLNAYATHKEVARAEEQRAQLNTNLREFLESKNSPLAPETDYLLEHKHWKLLVAVSAIESQYCVRQLGWNCWGIGGDSAYRHYDSIRDAIDDADNLIEHWQEKGRWLTVEDMNCHYVVPCNETWVKVVNENLEKLEQF